MSLLARTPKLPQTLAPSEAQQASGYKEADTIPWHLGRDNFGSHWLSAPYNWREQRAGDNKPLWQYCSIAAGYCIGPINYIGRVYFDGKEIANFGYTFLDGEDEHEFVINPSPALGQAFKCIVRRGSETQLASSTLSAGTGQDHPTYRGICWIEWINLDLGMGVTSLPSITVELGRDPVDVGDYSAAHSPECGVNAFIAGHAILIEQNGGFGLDAGELNTVAVAAIATQLEANGIGGRVGDHVKCHPVWTAPKDFATLFGELLAYVDGYVHVHDSEITFGYFPNAAPSGVLPEISEQDLEGKPVGGFKDWDRKAVNTVVVYKDWARNYIETPMPYSATGSRATPRRSDWPFIHDKDQAAIIAAEQSVAIAPDTQVALPVFKSRAVDGDGLPLLPGALLNYDYAPHSLDLACRILTRRMRSGQASDLVTVVRERGAFPSPYVPAIDVRVLPAAAAPGEVTSAIVRLWQLPEKLALALDAATPRQVAALVDRAHLGIIGAYLSLSTAGAAPWEQILEQRYFAAKCLATNGGVNTSATTLRVSTASVDFARFQAQSVLNQADDTLLLLVESELVSVSTIAAVSSGIYDLGISRARQGTTAASHANGVACWLFLRSELQSAVHAEFENVRSGGVFHAATATKYFKLALFTVDEEGLAKPDDPGLSLVLSDVCLPPTNLNAANDPALQPDGTTVPRVSLTWTAPASSRVVSRGLLRWEYKKSAGGIWLPGGVMTGDKTQVYAFDVLTGVNSDFRIQSEVDGFVSAWETESSFTVVGDTTAPAALASVTATAYAGYNRVSWPASVAVDISEYRIQRATNSGFSANLVTLGETFGLEWDDPTAVSGTQYWYRVYAIDRSENVSTASNAPSVTTASPPAIDVTPTATSAASKVGADVVYPAGDGSLFVKIQLSVPALPANAIRQEILVSLVNDPEKAKAVAQMKNSGTETPWIDDMIPGGVYYVWTRPWSASKTNTPTAVTGSPFTLSNGTVAAPTGLAFSAASDSVAQAPVRYDTYGGTPLKMHVTKITWTHSTSPNLGYYHVDCTPTSDTPGPGDDSAVYVPANQNWAYVYGLVIGGQMDVRVRGFPRGVGTASAYTSTITASLTANYGPKDMAEQAKNDVSMSGVKIGDTGASSVRQVRARHQFVETPVLAGGATSEKFNVSLTNRGFSVKPDGCLGNSTITADNSVTWRYLPNDAGSTSTNAVIELYTLNGFNLPAGANYTIAGEFFEYL